MSFMSPISSILQVIGSSITQNFNKNIRQHLVSYANLLVDIKLKLNDGTHKTFYRVKFSLI